MVTVINDPLSQSMHERFSKVDTVDEYRFSCTSLEFDAFVAYTGRTLSYLQQLPVQWNRVKAMQQGHLFFIGFEPSHFFPDVLCKMQRCSSSVNPGVLPLTGFENRADWPAKDGHGRIAQYRFFRDFQKCFRILA
jgi:hypothetical protein